MKNKLNFILLLSIGFLTIVTIYSCMKDLDFTKNKNYHEINTRDITNSIDPMTTNKVWVENGMLVIENYSTFNELINSLKRLASDSLYYSSVYNEIGYEKIDKITGIYNDNENVVLEKFENRFSYNSLRKVESNSIINFLKSGNEPEDYNGSFIYDETFQTLLNDNYEIKIGDYIFKYVDSDNIVVVSDGDYSKIERLNGKSIFEIEDELNMHIFNTSDPSCPKFVNRNDDGLGYRFDPYCLIGFNYNYLNNNWFWFDNRSFVPSGCGNVKYKWVF